MNTLLMLFIFVPVLVLILLLLNILLAPHKPDSEKLSSYECGFSPIFGQTRTTFHIHFFVVALLFLVFDLEILLILPLGVTLYQISNYGFIIGLIFFFILTIGFVYEINTGAIKITSNSSARLGDSNITNYYKTHAL